MELKANPKLISLRKLKPAQAKMLLYPVMSTVKLIHQGIHLCPQYKVNWKTTSGANKNQFSSSENLILVLLASEFLVLK